MRRISSNWRCAVIYFISSCAYAGTSTLCVSFLLSVSSPLCAAVLLLWAAARFSTVTCCPFSTTVHISASVTFSTISAVCSARSSKLYPSTTTASFGRFPSEIAVIIPSITVATSSGNSISNKSATYLRFSAVNGILLSSIHWL